MLPRTTKACLFFLLGLAVSTFLYNEFIIYYVVISQCSWPIWSEGYHSSVRVMFLADTHLLGPNGHWWDRLRREWQMERAFQTTLWLHSPHIVFILGDMFDDGKWSSDEAFEADLQRFHKMFRHPPSMQLVSVVGNHDVGFHYMVTSHKLKRIEKAVNASSSVQLLSMRNLTFVTVNSMAFEGDNCDMCRTAMQDLAHIRIDLICAEDETNTLCTSGGRKDLPPASPVLLQHYPMYRDSDSKCTGADSAPEDEKSIPFRPTWDCLSKEASSKLMDTVKPRLIVSGHTHNFCHRIHDNGIPEWTVPSFSWRNKNNPSFLMASISPEQISIGKCFMPEENTVIYIYIGAALVSIFYALTMMFRRFFYKNKSNVSKKWID